MNNRFKGVKHLSISDSLKTILSLSTNIKILYAQLSQIKLRIDTLNEVSLSNHETIPFGKSLIATTTHLMFLYSESILEEYSEILTHVRFPSHEIQIKNFKKDAQPAMKRFKKWSDKRIYRNILIAHNLRMKDKSSIFQEGKKKNFNAPHFDNDFVIIYYLHLYMCHCLGIHFQSEIDKIDNNKIIDKVNFTGEYSSLKTELPIISSWANKKGFVIEELERHIKFLKI